MEVAPISKQTTPPHPQNQCLLFKLPIELRCEIFEYCAWYYAELAYDQKTPFWTMPPSFFSRPCKLGDMPALLQTCKRLSREACNIIHQHAFVRLVPREMQKTAAVWAPGTFRAERTRKLFIEQPAWCDLEDASELQTIFGGAQNVEYVKIQVSPKFSTPRSWAWYPEVEAKGEDGDGSLDRWRFGPFIEYLKTMPNLRTFEVDGVDSERIVARAREKLDKKIKFKRGPSTYSKSYLMELLVESVLNYEWELFSAGMGLSGER